MVISVAFIGALRGFTRMGEDVEARLQAFSDARPLWASVPQELPLSSRRELTTSSTLSEETTTAGLGLEPRLPDPESGVLPLDDPAKVAIVAPLICAVAGAQGTKDPLEC